MKLVNCKTNLKISFLLLLLLSMEVLTFSNKGTEMNRLKRPNKFVDENTKFDPTSMAEKIRFKSKVKGDSEESNDILINSAITDQKIDSSTPEDEQIEIHANSATAKTEFSWGFLFWSFMNFGASNALSGHSGYWLSERNSKHDYWDSSFETPVKIDTVEIDWRLPPKKMKIFYKLDSAIDWIPSTETFSRDELKDKDGNKIPVGSSSNYNTIYFKKPLLCTEFRIMMNQPIKKKSFSINFVKFYKKNTRGIIKTTYGTKKMCWYVNTNKPRENQNVYTYPCLKSLMFGTGNEMYELTTNRLIKNLNTGLCVGYDDSTKEVVLKKCKEHGSSYKINYNLDSSMYFDRLEDTAIYVEKTKDNIMNFIDGNTEINVSSEADRNQYKKENMLLKGENYWASVPGQKYVSIQFFFGKIKCDCKENGQFDKKIIDLIQIYWVREPLDFTVYTWTAGGSWKNLKTFKNNIKQLTEITLVADSATGIMIRITDGKNIPDFGGMVSYAIKNVTVGCNSYKLKYGKYKDKDAASRSFDFEAQSFINKGDQKVLDDSYNSMEINFEQSVSAYKKIKTNLPSIDKARKEGIGMCKKLNGLSGQVGNDAISKLYKFNENSKKSQSSRFTAQLNLLGGTASFSASLGTNSVGLKVEGLDSKKSQNFGLDISFLEFGNQEEENIPTVAKSFILSGTSSKQSEDDEEIGKEKIGNKETPAENCLHIKTMDRDSISGFYYIKPECAKKPFRVFCDFTLFEEAVDLYIFKDGSYLPNPDLSYLNIGNDKDIAAQCGKYGLFPIEIHNRDTLSRIFQLLQAEKMDLTKESYVPLGYDFSCKNNRCSNIYNSISSPTSSPVMDLFEKQRNPGEEMQINGRFSGLGLLNESSMITFDSMNVKISALICSSNKTSGEYMESVAKNISCSTNISNNLDTFTEGRDIHVICPNTCSKSKSKIYGIGLYHGDSSVCAAAIHQGVLSDSGRIIVRIQSSGDKYDGALQNGIRSENHENDGLPAFIVVKYIPNCPYGRQSFKSSFIEQFSELSETDKNNLLDQSEDKAQELIDGLINDSMNKKIEQDENKERLSKLDKMRFAQVKSNNNNKSNKVNNKIIGADSLMNPDLGGFTAKAAAAATDAIGLLSGMQNNNQATLNKSLAAGLGAFGGFPGLGGLPDFGGNTFNSNAAYYQGMQGNTGNSANIGSQPVGPNDMAANLSLGMGTGGTYNMGNQQLNGQYSISNPANNANPNGNFGGPNPYDNISLAFSKPQTPTDPNLTSSIPAMALNANLNLSQNGNYLTPEAYQVPDNLLGPSAMKAGFDMGASKMDLSNKGDLLVDPTASSGVSSDGDSKDNLNTSGMTSAQLIAYGFNVETSQTAEEELNRLYDSSTKIYMDNLAAKSEKIGNAIQDFGSALNQAINATGEENMRASDFSSQSEHSSRYYSDSSKIQFSSKTNSSVNLQVSFGGSKSGSSKPTPGMVSGSSSSSCSISTISYQFRKMSENKEKMKGLIYKLDKKGNARIYKLMKIKGQFKAKLDGFSQNTSFKLDFTLFKSIEQARTELFSYVFSFSKKNSSNTNWDVSSKHIKGRKRAIGVTVSQRSSTSIAASYINLNVNNYYDFKLTIDLLFLSKGIAGVAFRVQDQFNYYAFVIDKNSGYKAIGKMINGEFYILKKISDGGILLNDWHQVIITVTTGRIKVYMYDKEIATKASSEKTIEVEDYTYVRGNVSVFINGVKGFFFDNLKIEPLFCWSAWEPKSNLVVLNSNSNIFTEDFLGNLEERYITIDLNENMQREGPSMWNMVYEDPFLGSYIMQSTLVSDISPKKQSSFLLLKDKNFCNGKLNVDFRADRDNGMISIIFKYSKEVLPGGEVNLQYYTFDLINENEPTFIFRYWNNGDVKVISSIIASQIKGFKKAYVPNASNTVGIEFANGRITIRVSQDGGRFKNIINTYHESIKCGNAGFGTSNTSAKFTGFDMTPPKLRLTLGDIDAILNKTLPYIPMPSARKIRFLADKIYSIRSKMNNDNSAFNYLSEQASLLGSVLGYNFRKNKLDSDYNDGTGTDSSNEIDKEISKNIKKDVSEGGWKTCVVSRSENQRKRYCQETYNNPIFQEKCQKNFCTECCEAKIDAIYGNVIHICKKTCLRATVAANTTNEYKNVCLNTPDSQTNVYGYCDKKMESFSDIQKEACKLDMCNLCCVTMDAMKKKNYSVDNLRNCYRDCNKEYNTSGLESLDGEKADCERKKVSPEDIFNTENMNDLTIVKPFKVLSTNSENISAKTQNELNRLSGILN